jgi:hypothetical protein
MGSLHPRQPSLDRLLPGTTSHLPSIGWVEFASLRFGDTLFSAKAKVDTGANTSSLHAVNIEPFDRDGVPFLRFRVPLGDVCRVVEAPLHKRGVVKSSEGWKDERYFVEADLFLGGVHAPILLSLNDRSSMLYPVLLGRSFLRDRYLVDVSRKFLCQKPVGSRR